jgi:hypothetical protein
VLLNLMQLTSPDGRLPNLLGHQTHTGHWRLVRKGVAPAFNPKNIRWATCIAVTVVPSHCW